MLRVSCARQDDVIQAAEGQKLRQESKSSNNQKKDSRNRDHNQISNPIQVLDSRTHGHTSTPFECDSSASSLPLQIASFVLTLHQHIRGSLRKKRQRRHASVHNPIVNGRRPRCAVPADVTARRKFQHVVFEPKRQQGLLSSQFYPTSGTHYKLVHLF